MQKMHKNSFFSQKLSQNAKKILVFCHKCDSFIGITAWRVILMSMNDKNLIDTLRAYVEENHLSWTQISRQLGVTQNTLTNWNKGGKISPRNRRAIIALTSDPEPTCSVMECQARDSEDPITVAMLKVWGSLSERDKARVYMHALEYRDGVSQTPLQLVQVQPVASQNMAAEPAAPYNAQPPKTK